MCCKRYDYAVSFEGIQFGLKSISLPKTHEADAKIPIFLNVFYVQVHFQCNKYQTQKIYSMERFFVCKTFHIPHKIIASIRYWENNNKKLECKIVNPLSLIFSNLFISNCEINVMKEKTCVLPKENQLQYNGNRTHTHKMKLKNNEIYTCYQIPIHLRMKSKISIALQYDFNLFFEFQYF